MAYKMRQRSKITRS